MNAVAEQEKKVETVETPQAAETARGYVLPDVNILEGTDAYILEAEMPGVAKEGLDIQVENNVLTLVGRRSSAPEGKLLYRESAPADYRRIFELDPSVNTGRIKAKMEQGVLFVTLPKAEQAKPHRVTVN